MPRYRRVQQLSSDHGKRAMARRLPLLRNGVFQDGVVVGAPSFHQGFYHAIGDTLGKSHTDECSHYCQTNLRHRLIVAHNDVEEGEIKRYPGEPRRKDER